MPIRVLIADDHDVVRKGLSAFLGNDPELAVVGEAEDRGEANKAIARDLGIAEKTVKTHVSSILGKLGLQSRTQAALHAARIGLVPLDQLGGAEPADAGG